MENIIKKISHHPLYLFSDFRKVFLGRLISSLGDKIFAISLSWYIISIAGEHSRIHLATIMAVTFTPVVIFGPFCGTLVDRLNKKYCMLFSDLFRFVVILSLSLIMSRGTIPLWLLYLLCFLNASLIPLFESSVSSSLIRLTDRKTFSAAAALDSSVFEISNVVGSAIGAIFIALIGIAGAFFFNSITFLISFALILFIKNRLEPEIDQPNNSKPSYFTDLKEGLKHVYENKGLFYLLILFTMFNFFAAPLLILIPMMVKFVLKESVNFVAIFEGTMALGAVLTAIILSIRNKFNNSIIKIFIGLFTIAICFLVLSITNSIPIIIIALFINGIGLSLINVVASVIFQQLVPDNLKGRFFSILSTVCFAVLPLSFIVNGIIAEYFSIQHTLILNFVGCLLLSFCIFLIPQKELKLT